ncbi:MAG: hypothetical protein J7L71_07235, partial [Spirochaetaceae bacterium]|nr:hypothetical protein [Spirochaetaceae bacterium]
MKKNIYNKGFAIINALVFCVVLIILGAAIAYITQIGYFSISAEARYQIAEKNANKGLLKAISEIYNGTRICNGTENISFSTGEAQIRFVPDENDQNCFIWIKGIFKNSNIFKIAVIFPVNSYWGAAVFRKLNSLDIKCHADIISCNETCKTPALITGNNATSNSYFNTEYCSDEDSCSEGNSDIRALVDEPYKISPELLESPSYLTNTVFKNAKDRNDIFNILSQKYGISFSNGTPTGITGQNIWNGTSINTCTAEDTTITCTYTNGTDITINYNPITGNFTLGSEEYEAIDLGNASLTINSFNGGVGAKIAAGTVEFTGKSAVSNLTLVAREKINIYNYMKATTSIINSNFFAKDYDIFNCHFDYEGGILYSSGSGYLKLRSDSNIGTSDNPTLIIADNQLDINGKSWAKIHGLIYITENPEFGLNIDEKGHFEIHGAIISNSLSNSLSMRCHTTI